jgi:hypothetical protein
LRAKKWAPRAHARIWSRVDRSRRYLLEISI